jgi:hypothetical protein
VDPKSRPCAEQQGSLAALGRKSPLRGHSRQCGWHPSPMCLLRAWPSEFEHVHPLFMLIWGPCPLALQLRQRQACPASGVAPSCAESGVFSRSAQHMGQPSQQRAMPTSQPLAMCRGVLLLVCGMLLFLVGCHHTPKGPPRWYPCPGACSWCASPSPASCLSPCLATCSCSHCCILPHPPARSCFHSLLPLPLPNLSCQHLRVCTLLLPALLLHRILRPRLHLL